MPCMWTGDRWEIALVSTPGTVFLGKSAILQGHRLSKRHWSGENFSGCWSPSVGIIEAPDGPTSLVPNGQVNNGRGVRLSQTQVSAGTEPGSTPQIPQHHLFYVGSVAHGLSSVHNFSKSARHLVQHLPLFC